MKPYFLLSIIVFTIPFLDIPSALVLSRAYFVFLSEAWVSQYGEWNLGVSQSVVRRSSGVEAVEGNERSSCHVTSWYPPIASSFCVSYSALSFPLILRVVWGLGSPVVSSMVISVT